MGGRLAKSNPLTGAIQEEYELNKEMAKREEADAIYNARQRQRQGEALMKDQIASFAANGIELEGSAKDLIEKDLKDAELEAMNMVYTGKFRRASMEKQARLVRNKGYISLAKDGGELAFKGGA